MLMMHLVNYNIMRYSYLKPMVNLSEGQCHLASFA